RVGANERAQRTSFKTLRYRGKAKVDLQNQFIGAACNVKHWLRLLAQRRFVRLPLHRPNGANGMSDIEGKVTRAGASERGQRRSFKIGCCNFCKGLFLKAGWRWVDRNYGKEKASLSAIEEESVNTLYAQSNQKAVP